MWKKRCRGSKFPFCSSDKPSHFEGSSPTREDTTRNSSPQSEKTPVHDPKTTTSPPGYPLPHVEGNGMGTSNVQQDNRKGRLCFGRELESVKEARAPTQETPEAERSVSLD
ncbi:hypothetical protein OS493_028154 [Desmophyllum pertusum]|uniref:Uncharacterized protein n=1 Tax=Desmophyllum pertusum TaxID=174260 RepID=A0A9X0CY06_9CNID|nr:hypothetical protein OS493_028154 [Desmophyllum pertusum]